jgi:hypothetical protein
MTAAERDRIREQVRASRQRQGLPEHVTDTDVLHLLAADVCAARNGDDGHPATTRPRPSVRDLAELTEQPPGQIIGGLWALREGRGA